MLITDTRDDDDEEGEDEEEGEEKAGGTQSKSIFSSLDPVSLSRYFSSTFCECKLDLFVMIYILVRSVVSKANSLSTFFRV